MNLYQNLPPVIALALALAAWGAVALQSRAAKKHVHDRD